MIVNPERVSCLGRPTVSLQPPPVGINDSPACIVYSVGAWQQQQESVLVGQNG
jgi:hypothetical protein